MRLRSLTTLCPLVILASSAVLMAKPEKITTLALGATAPAFTLPGVDGKNHSLKDYAEAKALVLVFTCNHCPDAIAARGKVIALDADYKDKGVAVVAISGNDDKALRLDELRFSVYSDSMDDMKSVAKEEGYKFAYLYDGLTQETTKAYGAVATPHVFIFDAERKLRYHGRIDDAKRSREKIGTPYVREALDAILAGEKVKTETTRAFGCSTKWSWKRDEVAKDNAKWKALPVTLGDLDTEAAKKLAANKTDKLRVINFWSTTCVPCITELPELVEISRHFQFRPFEVMTISTDPIKDRAKAEKILTSKQVAVSPSLMGSLKKEGRTTNNYIYSGENLDHLAEAIDPEWNGALPHTVIIAPDGKIIWRHNGRFDAVEMRRAIVKQLEAQDAE